MSSFDTNDVIEIKKNKKRRREKHRARYSPELSVQMLGKHHSRKRKHKSPNYPREPEPPRQGIKLFVSDFYFNFLNLVVVF